MPILPSVQKDPINVSGGQSNIEQVGPSGLQQFTSFVNDAAQDYFIDEKVKFDRVRLVEAQNVMEGHKARLTLDENEGFQNKLGEQAFLYKDDEGRDFVQSYTDRFSQSVEDTITQLQLTPDQQEAFRKMAQQDQVRWTNRIREHQVNQGFKYKESVLSNTVELASRKAMGSYQDIDSLNENLTTINAAVSEMGKQFGWSQAEITNKLAEQYAAVHNANMQSILQGGDFDLADSYLDNYSAQIPEINRHAFQNKITELKQDYATQLLINNIQMGVEEGSNPAFNTTDPVLLEELAGAKYDNDGFKIEDTKIPKSHIRNVRYNDPRVDAKSELIGRQLGMDWAKPIVTALRVAGEKSNNNQVSPAGAKGIMQFMPIAVEQVRRITGKTIDPNDPDEALWGAYKFVDWISKKYNTKDPAVIASYYNGGGQYIGQLKKGGANAITNTENRDYVNRINTFLNGGGYQKYINRSMIGETLDPNLIASLPPKEQAKVISAHKAALKQKEDARERESERFYEATIDAIEKGRATDLGQLDSEGLKLLTAKQQKDIKSVLKAENLGEYNNDVYLSYLTNPTMIKNMSNAEFRSFLMQVPKDNRESVAKTYAELTGRSVADAKKIQAEEQKKQAAKNPAKSIVTPENITKVLSRNAAAYGFGTKTGTQKKAGLDQKGSAFWVATINDITDRVREMERRNGKNLSPAALDSVVNAYLENAVVRHESEVKGQLYSPKNFKRKDVIPDVNNYVLRNVRNLGYTDIDKVPDTLFMKYYFRFYRGKFK